MCDFKNYAISVLSFIGSLCAPYKATLKAENHALQCTTAGPYNAILSSLLGPDLVGIYSISLAARVTACSTTLRDKASTQMARGHESAPIFALSPDKEKEFLTPSMACSTANAFDICSFDRDGKLRGKTAKVLTVSSRSLREHGGNGATPALSETQIDDNALQMASLHVLWIPTGDTKNKEYLEEWL